MHRVSQSCGDTVVADGPVERPKKDGHLRQYKTFYALYGLFESICRLRRDEIDEKSTPPSSRATNNVRPVQVPVQVSCSICTL